MCKNKINIFMLMIITFISFLLILLLKTVDLKNNNIGKVYDETWNFTSFSKCCSA